MNTEQKAKAYDQALERAKMWKYKSGMPKDRQGVLDDIFPELRESEDEKIRKWLIAQLQIKIGDNATLNNMIYKAIAWLEKQGKQKPQRMISAEAKEALYNKPTWSEEDDEFLRRAINATKDAYPITANWLISLRERMKGE